MQRASLTYVELHLHTCYSFLEGASQPEELIIRARELGYTALAITDHDGLYGAMEFAQTCRAFGLQPITGAELTLRGGHHLTLIAETREGYGNLCRLITAAHMQSPRNQPALDPALLAGHAAGLICLSGCRQGEIAAAIDAGDLAGAEAIARRYIEWFGRENTFLELQHNLVYGDTQRCRALAAIAERAGAGLVATGNVHYHVRERHRLQDAMVAIRHRSTLDRSHRERRPNSEFFLRSPVEMAERFAAYPEAIANSVRIAERAAAFDLAKDLDYRFPDYPVPAGETVDSHLEAVCREAVQEKYGVRLGALPRVGAGAIGPRGRAEGEASSVVQRGGPTQGRPLQEVDIEERLQEELRLVRKHGLSGFFLLYKDLLELGREVAKEVRGEGTARGAFDLPPGRGRGSSVSSLICYLIGLSHIDPLHFNLRIGRFLNDDLQSVPDIDLDFPRDIRAELIKRVYEHYGQENVALVCTFPTYRVRGAVRELGKVLGLPEAELDKLAKRSEGFARSLRDEMMRMPEYRERLEHSSVWRQLVELAEQIAGFPRHISQHVGGMIISSRPIIEMVPVQPAAMDGRYLCQWDKDGVDDAHFIKIDFLALGMLSLVEECLEIIAEQRGVKVDLSRIDFDDQAVYDQICAGDTIGVFQIESRAQAQMLPRSQPRSLEDLAVQVAIIRPGPIVGNAVNPYATNRKAKRADPTFEPAYDHPLLKPVLEETLGVVLYQDQVLEVAQALAGFTAGQGEMLRRAMSRKRSREGMLSFWEMFRDGAAARGVPEKTAKLVFDKLIAFSEFGFPKSHAAAFALLAYQSAWLRRYYAPEFCCALFNNQPMGFYPPAVFTNDAKRHGIEILPPDANRSRAVCSVEEGSIRIGFGYVRGIAEATAKAIVEEREGHGVFRSLGDFARRTILSREAAENLIAVGAFDGFGLGRREALWQFGLFVRPVGMGDGPHPKGERTRPGGEGARVPRPNVQLPLALPVEQDMVSLPEMTAWERMVADYVNLSFSPNAHPLGLLRPYLHEGIVSTAHLSVLPDGAEAMVAGLVVTRQRPGTAKGFVFLLIEDEFGVANIVIKPPLYQAQRLVVRLEPFVVIAGTLQRREGVVNLIARTIEPLDLGVGHAPQPNPLPEGEGTRPDQPTYLDFGSIDPAPREAMRTDPPGPGYFARPTRERRGFERPPFDPSTLRRAQGSGTGVDDGVFPPAGFWDGFREPVDERGLPTLDELREMAPEAHNFG